MLRGETSSGSGEERERLVRTVQFGCCNLVCLAVITGLAGTHEWLLTHMQEVWQVKEVCKTNRFKNFSCSWEFSAAVSLSGLLVSLDLPKLVLKRIDR